jgi:hypothetical protein
MKQPEPFYLGDAVYAQWDGYHIILTTNTHNLATAKNIIALDPEVLFALRIYENLVKTYQDEQSRV